MTNSGAGLASARLDAAPGRSAGRWVLSVMSDPAVVRPLPRHPGFELLFAFELGRHGVGFSTRRILPDSHTERRRTGRSRRGHEGGIPLLRETALDGVGFRALPHG